MGHSRFAKLGWLVAAILVTANPAQCLGQLEEVARNPSIQQPRNTNRHPSKPNFQDLWEGALFGFGTYYNFHYFTVLPNTHFTSSPIADGLVTLGANAYIPMRQTNDIASVGVQGGAFVGLRPSRVLGTHYQIQVPILAVARLGAGATRYNESPVGVGVGVGINPTVFRHTYEFSFTGGGARLPAQVSTFFLSPMAFAELNLNFGWQPFSIRIYRTLTNQRAQLDFQPGAFGQADTQVQVSFRQFGIGIFTFF